MSNKPFSIRFITNSIKLLLLPIFLLSQVPAGYYDNAQGKTGTELKTALYDIIKGHTEYTYTSTSTDVWDILKASDKDISNPNNVILIYSGRSVDAEQEYNSASGWSREHVWAKSRGDFGTDRGAGTDAHHLRPCDISVNSARNNRWFDECTEPYYDNGVNTGSFTSSTEWVWKPREEVVGDIARMMFYMATRYEGENGEPALELIDYIPSDKYTNEPIHAKLSTLISWHLKDTVDATERTRNDVIYSYQNNRNPFIDHPEYVYLIWGDVSGMGYIPNKFQIGKAYPNPFNPSFNLPVELSESSKISISLSNILGQAVRHKEFGILSSGEYNFVFDEPELSSGIYFVQTNVDCYEDVQRVVLVK
ncbi:endonuclease [bacterium]|nr:endonuclease [bacterium]